jgi:hypothetical protein
MARTEYRGAFDCHGSDGRTHTIKHFVSVTDVGLRSAGATKDGASELHCEGEVVRHVAKGCYQTVSGIDLTSDDPTAP